MRMIKMGGMRVVFNSLIPFKPYKAINLFGIIFVRGGCADEISDKLLRHEHIHTLQMKELWYIGFYFLYVWFYLKNRIWMDRIDAYYNNPFEREAYYYEKDQTYYLKRPKFNWRKL